MGTTKTAMQTGSMACKYIVLIEGYSHPLSDASEAQVQAALTGTDWASSTIIPGICVELENEQAISPWDPFTSGGRLVIKVPADASDTFGVDTHRKNYGDYSFLTTTLDNNDTTVAVKSTSGFASSGEAHIGTECFAYSGTTSTTFTGVTRGKYSPFGVNGGTRFGEQHRVGTDQNDINHNPIVSEVPRQWLGRWIGLWIHRDVSGTLDVKSEAQLVYAGRITAVYDDPSSMSTAVECKHVLDFVKDAPIGRDLWSAKLQQGFYVYPGVVARMADTPDWRVNASISITGRLGQVIEIPNPGVALKRSKDLVCVATAPGADQIQAGYYTTDEMYEVLNQWWARQLSGGFLYGTYTIGSGDFQDEGLRTYGWWNIPGDADRTKKWTLGLRKTIAEAFGWVVPNVESIQDVRDPDGLWPTTLSQFENRHQPPSATDFISFRPAGDQEPYRYYAGVTGSSALYVSDERGEFIDQYDSFPTSAKTPTDDDTLSWGIFVVNNKSVIRASKSGNVLSNVKPLYGLGFDADQFAKQFSDTDSYPIRQIFVFERTFGTMIKELFYSTGTSAYNHATYDTLGNIAAIGIPGILLGSTFEASVDGLPGAGLPMLLVISETTKISDLFTGDLNIRWAFLRWKNQILEFATWKSPTSGNSLGTFNESNKASPGNTSDSHRTSSLIDGSWQRSIVKIEYNRDITTIADKDGGYKSTITYADKSAIDDAGGDVSIRTIKARNTYEQLAGTGAGIESLSFNFLAVLPTFSRPVRRLTRSIDARYFEGYSVGDVMLVTDNFARDPDTGERGVAARPCVIVRHRWSPGGAQAGGGVAQIGGEVDLLLMDASRTALYVPAAQVDDTAASSGYNSGSKVLTCYAHKYSESNEAVDAASFPAGSKVRVIEIDPEVAASPLYWDDTVASQSGNTITLTTGLTGWDTTLKYRVVFDDYGDATADQKVYTYQADDADGMVSDARAPYNYGSGQADNSAYTANSASDPVELPPDLASGDGVARDVGHELAINRLVNNLIDYKTARSAPFLSDSVITTESATMTTQYMLVEIRPVFLTSEVHSFAAGQYRSITVAPWFRSNNGTPQSVRVSIVRRPPITSTSNLDVDRGGYYGSATFTTSSTTWATASPQSISLLNLKDSLTSEYGMVYILVEITRLAETRGLALCYEGPRVG